MDANGYVTHTVQAGDSLQKIAVFYNIEDWKTLAILNKLEYPFIYTILGDSEYSDNPKVLKVGDKLLIPSENLDSHTSDLNIENAEDYAYGRDLDLYSSDEQHENVKELTSNGELRGNCGDLLIANGLKNLRQRLLIRLSTPIGSLILHPEFGSNINKYIGMKNTAQNLIKMKLAVQECILSDELISEITRLDLDFNGGALTIDSDLVPVPPYAPFAFKGTITVNQ